jgi:hypothetical protein
VLTVREVFVQEVADREETVVKAEAVEAEVGQATATCNEPSFSLRQYVLAGEASARLRSDPYTKSERSLRIISAGG